MRAAAQVLFLAAILASVGCSHRPQPPDAPAPLEAPALSSKPKISQEAASPTNPPARVSGPAITASTTGGIVAVKEGALQPTAHGVGVSEGSCPAFRHATEEVGLPLQHPARAGRRNPLLGASVAAADVDGDGDVDLYATTILQDAPNVLYLNELHRPDSPSAAPGPLRFTEAAEAAGIARVNDGEGYSTDAVFGDLDGDGDADLYVVQSGKNRLFRNEGRGRFVDVTEESGTGDHGDGASAILFDSDGDGDLDIYVCNYSPGVGHGTVVSSANLREDEEEPPRRVGPESLEDARDGGRNVLYRNEGNLRFTEACREGNVASTGWSIDSGAADIDGDGDLDLCVANEFGPIEIFLNAGGCCFAEATAAVLGPGAVRGTSVDLADSSGDGLADILLSGEPGLRPLEGGSKLLAGGEGAIFLDTAPTAGIAGTGPVACAGFLDYDLDGDLDILAVSGRAAVRRTSYREALATAAAAPDFDPADISRWPERGDRGGARGDSASEPARLLRNEGNGRYADLAAEECIADAGDASCGVLADLDEDGDLDLAAAGHDRPLRIYLNDSSASRHWTSVRLRGRKSNRDGVGARIEMAAGKLRYMREACASSGLRGPCGGTIHFGLGTEERVDRLAIFWPSGIVDTYRDLKADRHYTIEESEAGQDPVERGAIVREPSPGEAAGRELLALEREIQLRPRSAAPASRYRQLAVSLGRLDRPIRLFQEIVDRYPPGEAPVMPRLQLALAFIDKIPSVHEDVLLGASVAKESLLVLDRILRNKPNCYPAHFIAGMNHLYWPSGLKHAPDAIRHFEFCRKAIEAIEQGSGNRKDHPLLERSHKLQLLVALGDAHVRDSHLEVARDVWKKALAAFPGDEQLAKRLSLADKELVGLVKDERDLDRAIDSSLPFLEIENDLSRSEEDIRKAPESREMLGAYRLEAAEMGAAARAEAFLQGLVTENPSAAEPLLHLALLEFDSMAFGEVQERAARATEFLRRYQERRPGDYLGHYFEALAGLRGLLEPLRQKRSASQREDGLARGVLASAARARRLTARPDGSPRLEGPVLVHGDALALAGLPGEDRAAWVEALRQFPSSRAARARLEAPDPGIPVLAQAPSPAVLVLLETWWRARPEAFTDLRHQLDLEPELERIEKALEDKLDMQACNAYRALVRRFHDKDRAIRFLSKLQEALPRSSRLKLQRVLALLDRLSDRSLGDFRKSRVSGEALAVADELAQGLPGAWSLQLLIGKIHLPCLPRSGHVQDAARALGRAMDLLEARAPGGVPGASASTESPAGASSSPLRAEAYRALGDASVLDHRFIDGRQVWGRGLKSFPGDVGLTERMSLTSLMVDGYVDRACSWEAGLDTDALSEIARDLPEVPR